MKFPGCVTLPSYLTQNSDTTSHFKGMKKFYKIHVFSFHHSATNCSDQITPIKHIESINQKEPRQGRSQTKKEHKRFRAHSTWTSCSREKIKIWIRYSQNVGQGQTQTQKLAHGVGEVAPHLYILSLSYSLVNVGLDFSQYSPSHPGLVHG